MTLQDNILLKEMFPDYKLMSNYAYIIRYKNCFYWIHYCSYSMSFEISKQFRFSGRTFFVKMDDFSEFLEEIDGDV